MGTWLIPLHKLQKQWRHVYSESISSIYTKLENVFAVTYAHSSGRRKYTLNMEGKDMLTEIPEDCKPITQLNDTRFELDLRYKYSIQPHQLIRTWGDYVHTLPPYEQQLIKNSTILNKEALLSCLTQHRTMIICIDGAYKEEKSGGAWIIAGENEEIFVTGFNPNTAHKGFKTSYRSEVQAGYSSILYMVRFCKFYNVPIPKLMYYCDNEAFIKKLQDREKFLYKASDNDLLQKIYNILPTETVATHVYGHQDEKKNKPLSLPEYLNTIADFIATQNKTSPIQHHPPNENAIYINNYFIPYNIPKFMRKQCYYQAAADALKTKYKWTNSIFNCINWDAHERVLKNNSSKQCKRRLKFIHNHYAFGKINFETKSNVHTV